MGGKTTKGYLEGDYTNNDRKIMLSTGADVFYDILDQEPEYGELIDIKGIEQGGAYFADFILDHDQTVQFEDNVYVPRDVLLEADNQVSKLQDNSNSDVFRGQLGLGLGLTMFGVNEFLSGRVTLGIGMSSTGTGLMGYYLTDKLESHSSARDLRKSWLDYTKADGGEDVVFKQFDELRGEIKTENHGLFEK